MSRYGSKSALSPARRRLVELLQELNFGRIEGLAVRGGESVFDPPPRVVREVKFCSENGPRPKLAAADFRLKAQQAELFDFLDRMGEGTITFVECKYGLPFRVELIVPPN